MRVVLGTNVLSAELGTHGLCERVLPVSFRDDTVVLSEHILREASKLYVGRFKASQQQTASVIEVLRKTGKIVVPVSIPPEVFDDPDDLPVLGTAVASKVEYLVTGDRDLLSVDQYRGIALLSPRDFCNLIRGGS